MSILSLLFKRATHSNTSHQHTLATLAKPIKSHIEATEKAIELANAHFAKGDPKKAQAVLRKKHNELKVAAQASPAAMTPAISALQSAIVSQSEQMSKLFGQIPELPPVDLSSIQSLVNGHIGASDYLESTPTASPGNK